MAATAPQLHSVSNSEPRVFEDGLGGSITILEEGSATAPMRFRMVMPKGFGPPAPESHPNMREDFRVIRGELDLGMVDGQHVVLREGETFTLQPGSMHLPANRTDEELEFEAVLTPGLRSAEMFAALYTQSFHHTGPGEAIRAAVIFGEFTEEIRFPTPVRMGMAFARLIAKLFRIRPTPWPR